MLKVIVLLGKGRSGKDYLAKKLIKDLGCTRHAFADDLKEIYCYSHPLSVEEIEADKENHRQGLINLAENTLKKYDPAFFGKRFLTKALNPNFAAKDDFWVITDARYKGEYDFVRDHPSVASVSIGVTWPQKEIEGCGYELHDERVMAEITNEFGADVYETQYQYILTTIKQLFAIGG